MATTASIHAHAAPQGFIRKYIFSLDHKVIGLQYYFLALTAVFVDGPTWSRADRPFT